MIVLLCKSFNLNLGAIHLVCTQNLSTHTCECQAGVKLKKFSLTNVFYKWQNCVEGAESSLKHDRGSLTFNRQTNLKLKKLERFLS